MALEQSLESSDAFVLFDIEDLSAAAGTSEVVDVPALLLQGSPNLVIQFEIAGGAATEDGTLIRYCESATSSGLDIATKVDLFTYDNGADGADVKKSVTLPDELLPAEWSKGNIARFSLSVPGGAAQGSFKATLLRIKEVATLKAVLT